MLNLEFAHGRPGVQPTVENLPKDRRGSRGFCGGFLRWILHKRNICRKDPSENLPAENKKCLLTGNPPTFFPFFSLGFKPQLLFRIQDLNSKP